MHSTSVPRWLVTYVTVLGVSNVILLCLHLICLALIDVFGFVGPSEGGNTSDHWFAKVLDTVIWLTFVIGALSVPMFILGLVVAGIWAFTYREAS